MRHGAAHTFMMRGLVPDRMGARGVSCSLSAGTEGVRIRNAICSLCAHLCAWLFSACLVGCELTVSLQIRGGVCVLARQVAAALVAAVASAAVEVWGGTIRLSTVKSRHKLRRNGRFGLPRVIRL